MPAGGVFLKLVATLRPQRTPKHHIQKIVRGSGAAPRMRATSE